MYSLANEVALVYKKCIEILEIIELSRSNNRTRLAHMPQWQCPSLSSLCIDWWEIICRYNPVNVHNEKTVLPFHTFQKILFHQTSKLIHLVHKQDVKVSDSYQTCLMRLNHKTFSNISKETNHGALFVKVMA